MSQYFVLFIARWFSIVWVDHILLIHQFMDILPLGTSYLYYILLSSTIRYHTYSSTFILVNILLSCTAISPSYPTKAGTLSSSSTKTILSS